MAGGKRDGRSLKRQSGCGDAFVARDRVAYHAWLQIGKVTASQIGAWFGARPTLSLILATCLPASTTHTLCYWGHVWRGV